MCVLPCCEGDIKACSSAGCVTHTSVCTKLRYFIFITLKNTLKYIFIYDYIPTIGLSPCLILLIFYFPMCLPRGGKSEGWRGAAGDRGEGLAGHGKQAGQGRERTQEGE